MSTHTKTPAGQAAPQCVESIDAATVRAWLDEGEAVLVDVREPDEHAREHIEAAQLMPLSQFDPASLPHDTRIVLHCQSGTRSMEAANRLMQSGRTAHSLDGGIEAWREQGYPTTINRAAPMPIMRQVQIAAGSLVVLGTLLGASVSLWWLLLSGFVGAGLVFAGVSGFCGMAKLLAAMPWNRVSAGH